MIIKPLASSSDGNCYYISDGASSILIDAGIQIDKIQRGTGFHLSDVAGALISHEHGDHARSVPALIRKGIDVYALHDVFETWRVKSYHCHVIENGIVEGRAFDHWAENIGSFEVLPFDVPHDVPNLGFYIRSTYTGETLLYFIDCIYVKYRLPTPTYLMAECNYDIEILKQNVASRIEKEIKKERTVSTHMSIKSLLEMLPQYDYTKIKQIYLMHLSDRNSNAEEFKRKVQQLTGCEVYICRKEELYG